MSSYLLLETGDKIEIEDESGFILLDAGFVTPHNITNVDSESRFPKVATESRSSQPSVN
jgi:hypothetical protein